MGSVGVPMRQGPAPNTETVERVHGQLRSDRSLQFERAGFEPPETPGWLRWIGDALVAMGPVLQWVFWIGLAALAGLILYAIIREVLQLRRPSATPAEVAPEDAEWRPDARAARDLLAEADALADQKRYAEATHLLLLRSVEDIEKRRPRTLRSSLTTREIATSQAVPEAGRPAFRRIGEVVERSLFGGAPVGPADFADCRRAYEDFALPGGWRA